MEAAAYGQGFSSPPNVPQEVGRARPLQVAMSWGEGPEASTGQTAFVAVVDVVVALLVLVAIYYIRCYVTQRRNLYISCRGPELLIIEVLVNLLCAVVVLVREVLALQPSGHRLSCIVTTLAALSQFCVNMSQVSRHADTIQQMTPRDMYSSQLCIAITSPTNNTADGTKMGGRCLLAPSSP
jgi:hypothetical protein